MIDDFTHKNIIIKFALFEKSVEEVTFDEVVTKTFINLQAVKNALNPYVSQYKWEEYGEHFDPDDDASDIVETKEFQNWLMYELQMRFNKLQNKFEFLVVNDNITLYRAMLVADDYLQKMKTGQVKRIGRFWTYEEEKAEPHHGYNQDLPSSIVFEADIPEKYINWLDTFRLNLEHEYLNEEDEMRLFKNTPVVLTNVIWNEKPISDKELQQINQYKYLI